MSESKFKTMRHIEAVRNYIDEVIKELIFRSQFHDQTKLESPEVEIFEEFTPKLKNVEYASDEYKSILKQMKVAIKHHTQNNRHHPEYFKNGISDMNLIDLIEMLCDWKASSLRMKSGDIIRSIEINQNRFGYSDILRKIFINTAIDILNHPSIYHKAEES